MSSNLDGDDELLQAEISKLEEKYGGDDNAFRVDLKAQGLGNLPFSAQTKKLLMKKLAQKRLQNSNSNHLSSFSSQDVSYSKSTWVEDESASESNSSLYSEDPNKTFYALCIPGEDDQISIESDFLSVLKKMKEYSKKKPRMLSFTNYFDAVAFANNTSANQVCQTSLIKATFPKEKAELENNETVPFPSVSVPQLNAFRIHLERGNTPLANEMISSNPRFLIGTGDVPTILKAGPRYNALHASVFAGQLSSCKLIMKYMCDIDYLKKMYETKERAERYSNRLVDLYLNTPEKMMNKTPLHFASEKGLVEIVAFLVSFNACDRHLQQTVDFTTYSYTDSTRKSALSPIEVACEKYYNGDKEAVKKKIINLIREATCFVPLVRSDTTGPYAKVVEPYSPSSHHRLVQEIEDNLKSGSTDDLKDFSNLKVWAYAGPMSPQEAHKFKREWWSPRVKKDLVQRSSLLNVTDGERGFEHYGRELAKSYNVPWQEYWPFLDSFANFNSLDGLRKLQQFFLKHSVLLHFDQLVNENKFMKCEALKVNEEFVYEIKEKEDNDSFISADSISDASSSSDNESDKDDVDDGKDKDDCFYDCQDKEEEERREDANHSMSPFRRLWNGLAQLGYYLSPKRGSSEVSEQSTKVPSSSDCDSNSNTLLPSEIKSCEKAENCDRNDCTGKMSYDKDEIVRKDEGQEEKQENRDRRKIDNVSEDVINKDISHVSISHNENSMSDEVNDQSETADSWDCKDPKHFSTPVSYRTYRNSTPADIISPDQLEVDSHTTPQSPDLQSPDTFNNKLGPPSTPVSSMNSSLNKKIDSFCRTLQAFSFKSPPESYGNNLGGSFQDKYNLDERKLSCMTLFTSCDTSQLEKLCESSVKKQKVPVLMLKQTVGEDGKSIVLGDMYLPVIDIESTTVLDENTHKAALGNVWLNFLVTFETWEDANHILSLDQPEIVSVKMKRISPPGRSNFSSIRNVGFRTLVDEYRKKKLSIQEDKENVGFLHLQLLAVRCSTLPLKDAYICGSIPTKTDADVYKSLNDEAVKLIHCDESLIAINQWFERMASSGQKSIESLPSPSRFLRLSRHGQALPPVSPLVKYDSGRLVDSPLSRGSRSKEDSVVRNIFKDSLCDDKNDISLTAVSE